MLGAFGSAFGGGMGGTGGGMVGNTVQPKSYTQSRFQNYGAPRVSKFAGKYGQMTGVPAPASVTNSASMGHSAFQGGQSGVLSGGSGMNGTANMPSGIQTLTGMYDMGNPTMWNNPVGMVNSPITPLDPSATSAFRQFMEEQKKNYRGPTGLGGQGEWVNGQWTGPQ